MPGASAMKAKASKKDQYLLKRRDAPEPAHRPPPPQLPDAPAPPALEDGPPGFRSGDPPTPPLPGSSLTEEEEFMLQRRAPLVEVPVAGQAAEGGAAAAAAEAEVELRCGERRTHICVPVRLVCKMRCRFGCSVGPCFLVPKILYAMQNGFGSPDACFVGDSLNEGR